jgi:AcrR family transcriptional regulator
MAASLVETTVNVKNGYRLAMPTVARPARMTREARREHFLDVAAELIEARGIEAVTMEGVAAAAGVSKGLGYAYFDNRGELLVELFQREVRAYQVRTRAHMEAATDFEGKLRAAVHGWFDMVAERGQLLGTLLQASQVQAALAPHRSAYNRGLEEFYGQLAADQLGIPKEKAVVAAAILIAGLTGVVDRWVECKEPRALLEETFLELTMGGLRRLAG